MVIESIVAGDADTGLNKDVLFVKKDIIIGGIFSINGDRYKIKIEYQPHNPDFLWGINTKDKILYVFNTQDPNLIENYMSQARRQYAPW